MGLPAYHVLGDKISADTRLADAGLGIEDVHVIPYMIDSGPAQGSKRTVRVTDNQFTEQGVRQAIEMDLANAHAVASIKGTGV